MRLDRMWINQPSTSQPLHHLHGINVLAFKEKDNVHTIYFLSGDTISARVMSNCLSLGWLKDSKTNLPV